MNCQPAAAKQRKLLMISYYFPPCGGGGVQRSAKFVRYLPNYGWRPTVLTTATSSYGNNIDLSHVADINEDIEIMRISELETVPTKTMKVLRLLARRLPKSPGRFHPREMTAWCFGAVRAALKAHQDKHFDLIYATGEPYSDFIIAWMLSRVTRVPYVLDMRDPWTIEPYVEERGSRFSNRLQSWAERLVLSSCSACVFANAAIGAYQQSFPQWRGKFHHIPNGYDSADFDDVVARRFDKFTIVYNGNLLPPYRTAHTFLSALRAVLSVHPELRSRIQVLFVGSIGPEDQELQALGLNDVVQHLGYVPHRQSIEYLKGADLLLLIGGKHRWEETGKVYEYLASGRPIFAVVRSDGAAAELLLKHSSAKVIDRNSPDEVSAALEEVLIGRDHLQSPANGAPSGSVAQWERRSLTGRLAQIMDDCVAVGAPRR